jgi:hypothetical protein
MSSSQERQPRRQKKQQQVAEESESESGSEEQYEPPKRSNRRSRQQNQQMQRQQQMPMQNQMGGGIPGTMGNVANQAMQQQQQGGGGGGKSDTLRLRLDLNLDIEITLKAKIHGDLELALLYVLTLFICLLNIHPLVSLPHPRLVVGGGSVAHLVQVDGRRTPPASSRSLFLSCPIFTGETATRSSRYYHHHTVTTSVLYLKNGQGHNVKKKKNSDGAPWTAAKGEKQGDIKAPPNPQTRIPDSACLCGGQGQKTEKLPKHVPMLLLSFPGWLVCVLAAQWCGPERLASCSPYNHVPVTANKEVKRLEGTNIRDTRN